MSRYSIYGEMKVTANIKLVRDKIIELVDLKTEERLRFEDDSKAIYAYKKMTHSNSNLDDWHQIGFFSRADEYFHHGAICYQFKLENLIDALANTRNIVAQFKRRNELR